MAKKTGTKKKAAPRKPRGKGKAPAKKRAPSQARKAQASAGDLSALEKEAKAAAAALDQAKARAEDLRAKARGLEADANQALRAAVAPYREACRKAGKPCEYAGRRSANVSGQVAFQLEPVDKGIRVAIQGRPETEEVIPAGALKASVNKAAYAYTDRHIGPKREVGNKGGSLSNRLRAAMHKRTRTPSASAKK